jgi:hypothetical protein
MAHCYADNITRPFWPKGLAKEQGRTSTTRLNGNYRKLIWQIKTLRPPGNTLSKENGEALAKIKASLPEKDWAHTHTDGAPKPYTFEQMAEDMTTRAHIFGDR